MIDEVHTLIGAGAAEGAIDAANILKPALARGELQCIGATTLDEYRKHIEKDPVSWRCSTVQYSEGALVPGLAFGGSLKQTDLRAFPAFYPCVSCRCPPPNPCSLPPPAAPLAWLCCCLGHLAQALER